MIGKIKFRTAASIFLVFILVFSLFTYADAKTADKKTVDVKTTNTKITDVKTKDAKTSDAETKDAKTSDAETKDEKATDEEKADAETKEVCEPTSAVVMLTGDLMCKGSQQTAAYDGKTYDFSPEFKYLTDIFAKSDILIGNLETQISKSYPLSRDVSRVMNKPFLNAPVEWVKCLKEVGYDVLITANNHACDCGKTGLTETIKALDKTGIRHTGTFKSAKEPRYIILEANNIKVGVLAYTSIYNRNDKLLSEKEQDYMLNTPKASRVKKDVKAARKAGAEFIIAYSHAGAEYVLEPNDNQNEAINALAGAGVDYIINTHSHCLQPYKVVESKANSGETPVWYSLGNFSTSIDREYGLSRESVIVSITLNKDETGKVTLASEGYYPTYQVDEFKGDKYVIIPEILKLKPEGWDWQGHFRNIVKTVGAPENVVIYR